MNAEKSPRKCKEEKGGGQGEGGTELGTWAFQGSTLPLYNFNHGWCQIGINLQKYSLAS